MRPYDAYLFDLDGTLVDTAPDLARALNACLLGASLPGVTVEQARHWVGHGARHSLLQALKHHQLDLEPITVDRLLEHFLDYYADHVAESSTPYDSVIDTLDSLYDSGKKLAVVTNKPTRFTMPLLTAMCMNDYFRVVICGDTAERPKPAPDPILLGLEQLDVPAKQTLMVGDSITDVNAAKAAGVDVACFLAGYNQGIDVHTLEPTYVFAGMKEILPTDLATNR